MTSRPIPDPEPWVSTAGDGSKLSTTTLASLDGMIARGTGVVFLDTPADEREAVARHFVRRAEQHAHVVASAAIEPEPWIELALQCGVTLSDAASTARDIARSEPRVLVVVEPRHVSRWGEAVCTELARILDASDADPRGTLVVVLTARPAAIARQLTVSRFGAEDMRRFFEALIAGDASRASTFDSPAALEAWWHKRREPGACVSAQVDQLAARLSALGRSATRALAVELGSAESLSALIGSGRAVASFGRVRLTSSEATPTGDTDPEGLVQVADALLRTDRDAWSIMRAAELRKLAGATDWRAAIAAVREAPDAASRADLWRRFEDLYEDADGDAPTLSTVAAEALACGDSEQALRLAQRALADGVRTFALHMVTARALRARGDLTAAEVALETAREHAASADEMSDAAVEAAEQQLGRGGLVEAREHANGALDAAPEVRLAARNVIGKVLLSEGAWDEAEHHFAADEQSAREAGLTTPRLRARLNRAIAVMSAGRRGEARTLLESVLEEGRRHGDRRARAFALANLSTFATDTHDYGAAIDLLERAIDDVRAVGDQPRLSRLIANLAELRLRVGLVAEAEQALTFARQACGPTPGGPTASLIAYVAAHARLHRGFTLQAAAEIDDAIRAAVTSSNGGKLSQCCRLATRIALEDGDVVRADRYLGRAKKAGSYQHSDADMAVLAARIDRAAGRDFASSADEALELAQAAGDVELVREAHTLCHLAHRETAPDKAERHLDAALRLRDHLAAALPERMRDGFLARRDVRELASIEQEAVSARTPVTLPPASLAPRVVVESSPSLESAMERLVGDTDVMCGLRKAITKVGKSDATVLIHGESGTGKELVADAIHAASGRANGPIVKINCAALVETLLLSELFGHERGAFTGAHAKRRGRFEQANGGTIFLDEIGDISPKTQVALLRVLQERTFERVGGQTPVVVDVRVVCATHRNLREMVEAGRFREDLYYRLCGVTLQTPALRERTADLASLSAALLERIAADHGEAAKRMCADAVTTLMRHRWPGNVRELENALRAASLFADGPMLRLTDITDNVATLAHLADGGHEPPVSQERAVADPTSAVYAGVLDGMSLPDMKRALERACIERALLETDGNITQAAKLLGMKRPRLSQLVNQYARQDADTNEGVAS